MKKKQASPPSSAERIVAVATRLFAEHGYDGVTTRQIAAATGLNISTVHHHVGAKRDLYLKVIEMLHEEEKKLVHDILHGVDDSVIKDKNRFHATLFDLIGKLLAIAKKNPARQRLYVRRWLDAPDELRQREAELTLRLYRRIEKLLKRGQRLGVVDKKLDIGYFLRSCDWMIFGYFTSGAFAWRTLRTDPARPANLAAFKKFLCRYTEKMLET